MLAALTTTATTAAIGALTMAGASGCGPSQEKIEANRVLTAIDRVRDAPVEPPSAREAPLTELERVQASSPPAVKARDACAKAFRLLVDGKKLSDRVAKQLADPRTLTLQVAQELADAEAKIEESAASMPACETAVADLRRPGAAGR
jgi:hypothetical protein